MNLVMAAFLVAACAATAPEDVDAATAYSFMSIGDWGGAALEDYHQADQYAVAKAMAATATALSAKLVIGAGDNYY